MESEKLAESTLNRGGKMLTEIIYHICKFYFMILGLFYVYTLFTGDKELFVNVTGIIALLFLISNIRWYTKKG